MSVASNLMTALATTALPIAQTQYTGSAATFITFSYQTRYTHFGDDAPLIEHYRIYVDLIAPATVNTTTIQTTIKGLLIAGGYDPPTTVDASDDPLEQHIVFETGIDVTA